MGKAFASCLYAAHLSPVSFLLMYHYLPLALVGI